MELTSLQALKLWACVAGLAELQGLPAVRAALAESLRLYPQPPILIRRALAPDTLPAPLNGDPAGYPIGKGADLFISVWNLHRWLTHSRLVHACVSVCRKTVLACVDGCIQSPSMACQPATSASSAGSVGACPLLGRGGLAGVCCCWCMRLPTMAAAQGPQCRRRAPTLMVVRADPRTCGATRTCSDPGASQSPTATLRWRGGGGAR